MANSNTKRSRRRINVLKNDILTSFISAFKRTIDKPFAFILLILVSLFIICDVFNSGNTPFDYFSAFLHRELKTGGLNKIELLALKFVSRAVDFLTSHENKVIVISAAAIPAVLRPSTVNISISTVIAFCAVALPSVNIYIFVAISVSFWFYTQFDNSGNKLVAIIVCVAFMLVNVELDVLDAVLKEHVTELTKGAPQLKGDKGLPGRTDSK